MRLLNFNIIKLTLFLILGIVFSHLVSLPLKLTFIFTGLSIVILFATFIWQKNKLNQSILFGLLSLLTTFFIGVSVYCINKDSNYTNHYTNYKFDSQPKTIHFQIKERLKPSLYHEKYIVNLIKVDSQNISGKLVLNVSKDSLKPYKVDDYLVGNMTIQTITKPLNPYQFDYKKYLMKKGVYGQIYTERNTLKIINQNKTTIYGVANSIRNHINYKLKEYPFSEVNLALINALLLGQKQEITKATYKNYANAGVIHILAISGLHIGIILLILNRLFNPLIYLKHGRIIKTVMLVITLWCFAIISGLSPSVTRAVTMFSVIAIAMNYKRPTNIYNTLAISAFLILLIKPMFLFEVGFQLSYLAVFGIVSLQPKLYKYWSFPRRYWLTNKIWEVITVTITAQLAILPLTLFYFHRFPGLFLLSNIVLVPFLGIILFGGILVIVGASVNFLPSAITISYNTLLNFMNTFVNWIASKESFLFKNISFSWQELIVWYLVLIFSFLFITLKNAKRLQLLLLSIIILQLVLIINSRNHKNNELVIFHKSRKTIIAKKVNNEATFYHNTDTLSKTTLFNNYITGSYIKNTFEDSLKPIYSFNDKTILLVDSLGIYNLKTINPGYIILRNSPKINLNRILDSIQPKTIIADGSNYRSYVEQWKITCLKRKIPFHYTGEKGAYIFKE